MKKYISTILFSLFAVLGAVAQNTVSVSIVEGTPGEVANVDVLLQNSDNVTAAEVVIPLVNKQLTYVDGSCMIDSERANGHRLSAAVVDGALKIYIYSMSLAPFNGNDGKLASFSLRLGSSPAEYPLQPKVVLSDTNGKALPVSVVDGAVTILAPQIEVVTPSVDFGRVPIMAHYSRNLTLRNSGTLPLEVSDMQLSNNIFSISETAFNIAAGATKNITVNYSPTVRGAVEESITVLSNATNGNATIKLLAEPYSVNELHSSRVEGFAGEEVTVELRMNNMEPIVGLQTTFTLPNGIEYVDGSFATTERASSHTAMASFSNGKLSLFLYSARNAPMSGNDGVLATFRLRLDCNSGSYNISPQNTVLSNAAQENMVSAVSGEYIVVKSPNINGSNELDFGRTPVTETAKATYVVYNNGKAPLVINNVVFLSQGYSITNALPLSVEPGTTAALNVEYVPAAEGTHSTAMNIYSNDPDEKMKSVKVSGTVYEPNNLTFEGENLQNGDYVVSIGLENYTGIVAMQMDIHWVPGMTTSGDRLKVSERLARHSCSITKMDEDTYRFVAFTFSNTSISGNSGKLFDLTFTPGNGVDYKDTPIVIDNVVLSSSGANNYTSQLALNVLAEYSHYYVRFMCEDKLVSECFQKVGSAVVYPQMPERTGHSFHWELEGGNKTLAYPIDIAGNADNMLYSNAYYTGSGADSFQGWHVLFDDNTGTYFHSEYASNKTSTDGLHHYLRVDLGAGNEVERFSFTYATRRGYTSGSPTRIIVEGSNVADGRYEEIAVLTGMPTSNSTYSSDTLGNGNRYRYIRFRVTNTSSNSSPSGHPYFYISEFGMTKYVKVPKVLESVPSNDVVLNGLYTPNSYRVTYKVDGEVVATDSVVFGNEIVLRENPTKEGHTFSGWSDVPESMPAEEVFIEGSFTVNSYNVIYKVDGEDYETVSVPYGTPVTLIEEPVREGHTFSGWSEAPEVMPANDITIEGSFIVNKYAVIYNVDGVAWATDSVAFGNEIALREYPTKEGHTFSGWSEAPASMPAEDVVIEGSFVVNTYAITYRVDGEVWATDSVAFGNEIALREYPTKEGHTFSGWSEAPATMPAEDITIDGSFVVNTYAITYKVDGEVWVTDSVAFGNEITLREYPAKEGHTFSGWSEAPATMPANDITVEGGFSVNSYNLIYKIDGQDYKVVPVVYGTPVTLIDEPVKEGHTFGGWKGEQREIPGVYPIDIASNADNMLYSNAYCTETRYNDQFVGWHVLFDNNPATFFHSEYNPNVKESSDGLEHYIRVDLGVGNEIEKFSFTYSNRQGSSSGSPTRMVVEGSNVADGEYEEIAVLTGMPTYNSTYTSDILGNGNRYRFVRFRVTETYSNQSPSGHPFFYISEFGMTRYVEETSIPEIMPAEDVVIEGTFAVNSYVITYMVDGEVYKTETVAYGAEIPVVELPVKAGHTFDCWTGIPATMPAMDITVNAGFTVNSYVVTYMVDGELYRTETIVYDSEVVLPEYPTKEGHTFSGWSEAPATMPAEDITIEGSFVVNKYAVIYKVGGVVFATDSVAYGCEVILREQPTKIGHTFSGWSDAPATMPAEDITIEGSFAVNSYVVTYMVDGEVYKTETIAYGSKFVLPENPTKEGHTFSGWKDEKEDGYVTRPIDIASNADKMLYSNAYCTMGGDRFVGWHVLFDNDMSTYFHSEYASDKTSTDGLDHYLRVDLGDGNEIENFSFTYTNRHDNNSGAPTEIVVEGSNVADGEYTEIAVLADMSTSNSTVGESATLSFADKAQRTVFNANQQVWVQNGVVLKNNKSASLSAVADYAKPVRFYAYSEVIVEYELGNITQIVFDCSSSSYATTLSKSIGDNATTTVSSDKVTVTLDGTSNSFTIAKLTAQVRLDAITVTCTAQECTTYNSDILGNGDKYRYIRFRTTKTASNSSPSGYPYFCISEFGMTEYVEATSIPETMPAEDVVIEGSFVVNTYAITYKVDGEVWATDSIAYGCEITLRDEPTKEGYTFSGWSEAPATMPASDITIEGSFAVNYYTVTYIVDGEIFATDSIAYGCEITLRDEPTKDGYTFSGWSEAPATMPASDVVIEGTFAVNYYTVTYKVDGEIFATDSIAYGSELILRDEPTKEGYTFSGWSEAPATMPASDVVIEGTFAVNYYTVTYFIDGIVYQVDSIAYGSEIITPEHPVKDGYSFSGWRDVPKTMPAEDIEITSSFVVNGYKVIYKVDGEEYQSELVEYGSVINLPKYPIKEGHTFSGWQNVPESMPAKDITIDGIFTVNSYAVVYKVDSEPWATDSIAYGSEIVLRDEPTKEGYTFSGWSEAPATMPAGDVIVEGTFTVNTYNVIYKVDGEEYKVVSVTYGSDITLIDEPTKEGHTFSGWSEAPATMPAGDVTIEGSFAVNYYTVTYIVDGEIFATDSIAYGSEITLRDEPTKEGYTFSGWSEAPATMPAEDVIIEGAFAVNYYTVTYIVDGEVYATETIAYGSEIVLRDEPTKEGHTFSGWSEAPATMPANDITIEGIFTVNNYTVTYLVDGEVYATETVAYGSVITLLDEPTKEGHTFSGWSEAPATMPAEDVTINGVFTVNTYNVIYKVDGEEYQVVPVTYGSEIKLINEPTKEGHTFSGWSEVPATMPASDVTIEGSFTVNTYNVIYKVDGEEYQVVPVTYGSEITLIDEPTKEGYTFSGWSEAPATMPAEDVIIEGSFAVNYYTVTYIVDGEIFATDSIAYGSELILRDEPSKEGYTFSGWSEAPATMPAEDVIIEGSFAVNYYTVTYIVDGEIFATDSIAYGSELVLRDEPTKEGYTFSGWSEAPATMPAHDIVVEGTFSPITIIDEIKCDIKERIIYNLRGERIINVDKLERGFYIIDGKKVWIN